MHAQTPEEDKVAMCNQKVDRLFYLQLTADFQGHVYHQTSLLIPDIIKKTHKTQIQTCMVVMHSEQILTVETFGMCQQSEP